MKCYCIGDNKEVTWSIFTDSSSGFCYEVGGTIANVLSEVKSVFLDIFGNEIVNSHKILSVVPCSSTPITFRKQNLIFLTSTGLFHMQHIYQFAHELCHFMVPDKVCENFRWFEETLCEAMSWYALLKIEERSKFAPIAELLPLYSKIGEYVSTAQAKRIRIANKPISSFIAENLPFFQKNCYNRGANAAIAYDIFPLFQEKPELWKIVPSLHILADNMSLHDALSCLLKAADVVESVGDQLIQRMLE